MRLTSWILSLVVCLGANAAQAQYPPNNPIKHVVVIVQENRSPDARSLLKSLVIPRSESDEESVAYFDYVELHIPRFTRDDKIRDWPHDSIVSPPRGS